MPRPSWASVPRFDVDVGLICEITGVHADTRSGDNSYRARSVRSSYLSVTNTNHSRGSVRGSGLSWRLDRTDGRTIPARIQAAEDSSNRLRPDPPCHFDIHSGILKVVRKMHSACMSIIDTAPLVDVQVDTRMARNYVDVPTSFKFAEPEERWPFKAPMCRQNGKRVPRRLKLDPRELQRHSKVQGLGSKGFQGGSTPTPRPQPQSETDPYSMPSNRVSSPFQARAWFQAAPTGSSTPMPSNQVPSSFQDKIKIGR
ncbi:hypothetical protein OG21DRAFT_415954 [Imleria badia]|nr:hypothetical protein OG21DRAFT_415954 [Imleria badia]